MTEILKRIKFSKNCCNNNYSDGAFGFGFSIGYDDDDKYKAVINYPLIMGL